MMTLEYAVMDNNDLNAFAEAKSKIPRVLMRWRVGLPETRQALVLCNTVVRPFVELVAPYETDGHKLE